MSRNNLVIALTEFPESEREWVGGKAFSLGMMAAGHLDVPMAICISAKAYEKYMASTGLRERILIELKRKDFSEMRWEEIWDASLRIRNMFLTTPIPDDLAHALGNSIERWFQGRAVVVRSSAVGEDSQEASFAGLHESYVNIRGKESILDHVKKVWASLWSDAALLYRQELGLKVEKSTMAVVVQEIVAGERSGVVFGKSFNDENQTIIEAVYGLNQGLVDGTVEPDRWILDRADGTVITHSPAERIKQVVSARSGVLMEALSREQSENPPLGRAQLHRVLELARQAERLFGAPQDVEWTFCGQRLFVLQSRPITTPGLAGKGDERTWYLSLRKSFDSLKTLREKIEGTLIPAMVREADELARTKFEELGHWELAEEIQRRKEIYDKWVKVYWKDFIPFAHGARLFGQVYNDTVKPKDPYEFVDLLAETEMVSLERNRLLLEMAEQIRAKPALGKALKAGNYDALDSGFASKLKAFIEQFGDLSCREAKCEQNLDTLSRLLTEMASHNVKKSGARQQDTAARRSRFLDRFEGEQKAQAVELLDLARISYQLRDDDNIYLGRISGQMITAVSEAKSRITEMKSKKVKDKAIERLEEVLKEEDPPSISRSKAVQGKGDFRLKPRQLIGQPAGPGISSGPARVVLEAQDLSDFRAGEILVCDAVEPNMTFVVPLAAGIVERRGGMLIHGAIIAREYGIPCVTGIPNASTLIDTGNVLTIDGYLGIVTVA